MLSEGYSMLYRDASKLDLAELLLYVKVESEAVDKIVTAVAEVGGQLKREIWRKSPRIILAYESISTRCRKWRNASAPPSPRTARATSRQ
jgi:hypothetical protein